MESCALRSPPRYDVVAFGEALVRLPPPHFQRLEQTTNLDVQVGGGELNVAVGGELVNRQALKEGKLEIIIETARKFLEAVRAGRAAIGKG